MLNHRFLTLLTGLPLMLAILGCGGSQDIPRDEFGQVDSDGDGFSDRDEHNGTPGTDPEDPADHPGQVRDSDGDGCSDYDETHFNNQCDNDPRTTDGNTTGSLLSISGRVRVSASAVVDGDTRDLDDPTVDNDGQSLSAVQELPNPSTVAGYLGTLERRTDSSDVFKVTLTRGQHVALLLADATRSDFDLFLYDLGGQALSSSEGTGAQERVIAPDDDTYLIEVLAYSVTQGQDDGGLYTLLVGDGAASLSIDPRDHLSSLLPMCAGEVLCGYTDTARTATAHDDAFDIVDAPTHAGGVERRRLRARGRQAAASLPNTALVRPFSDTIAAIKQLRRVEHIAFAEPNLIRQAMAIPNDEYYGSQWHYPQISLPQAWDITTGSSNVIVAVIDTGVVLDHPELAGQLVPGYDFISDPASARDGDGIDSDPNDVGDLVIQGTRSSFHGTHVSGTVAARSNNNIGVAGVAWGVKVMPLRVLGAAGGNDFDIIQAIRFAAGLPNSSGTVPTRRADVINLSLGGPGYSAATQDAITAARAAGVIVIAAAGNESANADFSTPAGLEGVVTVSAVDVRDNATFYSNFGSSVDVAAPGGDMGSDSNGDTYPDGVLSLMANDQGDLYVDFSQGTSMACPHVAGVAALMKSINPDLSPTDFDQLLAGTHPATDIRMTEDLGAAGRDDVYGHGLINAFRSVQAASAITGRGAVHGPIIQVSDSTVDFGIQRTAQSLTLRNIGTDTLEITDVSTSEPWLDLATESNNGLSYRLTVDRSGLTDGMYSATVRFESNGGTATVAVRMQVGDTLIEGGVIGTVYVLVIDADTGVAVAESTTTYAVDYTFEIDGLRAGRYLLFAGTDLDSNRFIDNQGELIGAYPTLRNVQSIEIDRDLDGLEFTVSHLMTLSMTTTGEDQSGPDAPVVQRP